MIELILIVVGVVLWFAMTANGWGPITAAVVLVVLFFVARFIIMMILGLVLAAASRDS